MAIRARNFNTFITGDTKEDREKTLSIYEIESDWLIAQDETDQQGVDHIQVAFGFNNPKTLNKLQKTLPQGERIQVTRDTKAMIAYCSDENKRNGKLYTSGDIPNFIRKRNEEVKNMLTEAKEMLSYEEAMKHIEEQDIAYYICNKKKLSAYYLSLHSKPDNALYDISTFNIPPILIPQNKTLIFIGPTNIGKTQFALAHFDAPLLCRSKQDWSRFVENKTDGIVLDDIAFKRWSSTTILHTVERETATTMDIKYGHVRIPPNIPKIICLNDIDEFWPMDCPEYHREAISRRIEIHNFYTKLYCKYTRLRLLVLFALSVSFNITDDIG